MEDDNLYVLPPNGYSQEADKAVKDEAEWLDYLNEKILKKAMGIDLSFEEWKKNKDNNLVK